MADDMAASIAEELRYKFEKEWQTQEPEALQRYLPTKDDRRYIPTLEELIHIDIEFAWKQWSRSANAARPLALESYIECFPGQLDEQALRRLIVQEVKVRRKVGDPLTAAEHASRFPDLFPTEWDFWTELGEQPVDEAVAETRDPVIAGTTVDSATEKDDPGRPSQPDCVGEYENLVEIGRGGMGVVYRAHHRKLDREVAVKMILGGAHAGPAHLDRFLNEARAVAQLQHPNIVQIFEIGDHQGLPFLALEFVDGPTLSESLSRDPMPPREAAKIVEILARTMQYAHDHQVLHRDLKPANVLLTAQGVPKISDFGLAKQLESDSGYTRTGMVVGTPSYMAPEQARGAIKELGPASDQYSLGAILYSLLTGRPPFLAADPMETVLEVIHNEPIPARRLQPSAPLDLDTICTKVLQKEAPKRYANCTELADDLRRFQDNEPILARPIGRVEKSWRWCRRNPRVASLISLSALLLVAVAGVSSYASVRLNASNKQIRDKNKEVTTQQRLAEERADLAIGAIQTLIVEVKDTIADTPKTQELKRALLEKAAESMRHIAGQLDKTSPADPTLAAALGQLGDTFREMGDISQAMDLYKQVYELLENRPRIKGGSDPSRNNVAVIYWRLAEMSKELERDLEASVLYNQAALRIFQDINDNPTPGKDQMAKWLVEFKLAESQSRVAVDCMRLGRPNQALTHVLTQLELYEKILLYFDERGTDSPPPTALKPELDLSRGTARLAAGSMLVRLRRYDEAKPHLAESLKIARQNYQTHQDVPRFKQKLAQTESRIGDLYFKTGKDEQALEHYLRGEQLALELADEDPQNTEYQRDLSRDRYRLGCFFQRQEDHEQSLEWFEKSHAIREQLFELDTNNERRKMELMLTLAHRGETNRALSLAEQFADSEKLDNELRIDLARCWVQCSLHTEEEQEWTKLQQQALHAIATAIDEGYRDEFMLATEPDLAPLHSNSEFDNVLKKMDTE